MSYGKTRAYFLMSLLWFHNQNWFITFFLALSHHTSRIHDSEERKVIGRGYSSYHGKVRNEQMKGDEREQWKLNQSQTAKSN